MSHCFVDDFIIEMLTNMNNDTSCSETYKDLLNQKPHLIKMSKQLLRFFILIS